jgi:hypothetical protein
MMSDDVDDHSNLDLSLMMISVKRGRAGARPSRPIRHQDFYLSRQLLRSCPFVLLF